MIAMVMVSAKVWKNLQKITFHLIYMKILLLNTIVHGMLNTVTDVNVITVLVYVNVSQDIMVMHVKHKQH